jgi:hypothetical protein
MTRSTIASSRRHRARALTSLLLIVLAALPVPLAAAEPPRVAQRDATLAEALFREARKLMGERRFSEACPKLEESQRLDPGGGTLLNLGICHAKAGKTATAWAELREALGAARRDGRADREDIAKKQLAELEPRMSQLVVEVPVQARVAGLELKLDGRTLSPAAWGSAFPIDPGDHKVEAKAPRRRSFTATIAVKAEHDNARITLPVLPEERAVDDGQRAPAQEPAAGGASSSGSGLRTGAFIFGGVALIGIGIGSGFGVDAILKEQRARQDCENSGPCENDEALRAGQQGQRSARIADIVFAAGGVSLATGVVLFLLSRSTGKPTPSAAQIIPIAGPSGGGAVWQGAF